MAFYDIKTKVGADGKPISLGFPYPNGSFKVRQLEKKAFHSVGDIGKAGLFGRNKFGAGSHKYITITEGELDAASLYQVIRSPVVSVHSSSSAGLDCSIDRSYLNSFERIYLAFDNDDQGRDAAAKVAKLFDYNKVWTVKFDRFKDANGYLEAGQSDELRQVWWNSKKYLPETVISSFHEFKKILDTVDRKGVDYPFPTLNHMTYGIRTGESILITAMEGVGKTELMHAIEYQLLKETDDNVGAIFLEEPKKRHLQSLAGLEIKKPVHLPDGGASSSDIYSALTRVIRGDDRLHVYSHFGSNDPEVLLDTIRFLVTARSCRYILFDHITMAVSGLGGEDERRALDYLSTRLEVLVKELDFALIFVSHVNDNGQTRGSRNISKVADIRIDAYRNLTDPNPVVRNTTNLVISKNRFSGKTGPAGSLLFNPLTYTLTEVGCEEINDGTDVQSIPPEAAPPLQEWWGEQGPEVKSESPVRVSEVSQPEVSN
jgi:twinkle protein